MFIFPSNLKAKPKLWLWELRDVTILGISLVLSVLAVTQGIGMAPLMVTVLFGFLSIRVEGHQRPGLHPLRRGLSLPQPAIL